MAIKLGNTDINKLYLGSTEIKKAYLGSTIILDNTVAGFNYDNVTVMYSLRQPLMTNLWSQAVLKLRRSSDDEEKYVFFDSNGTISLDSKINTGFSSPGTTSLATWVGSNDAYIATWVGINPTGSVSIGQLFTQTTVANQPKFITSGVISNTNSLPSVDFLSDVRRMKVNAYAETTPQTDFTILTVSSSHITNAQQGILCLGFANNSWSLNNDGTTGKNLARVKAGGGTYETLLLAQQNTTNQKLISLVSKANKDMVGYYNGDVQTTGNYSNDYFNFQFRLGVKDADLADTLNGTVQEVILFDGDKTSDLAEIHTDINNHYNIY